MKAFNLASLTQSSIDCFILSLLLPHLLHHTAQACESTNDAVPVVTETGFKADLIH